MFMSAPKSETAGMFSQSPITGLGWNRSMENRSSACSNDCTGKINIRVAASDWRYVSASWSNMAAASGSTILHAEADPPFASPFPPAPDDSQASDLKAPSISGPRTVLLVEDNPMDVFVIRELLEGSGLDLHLHIAGNGQDALQYLKDLMDDETASWPALVLLDLNLPKVPGIEVLKELRADSRFSRTPVIVLTSSTAPADRLAVELLGAEAYFQKPSSLEAYKELGRLVKGIFGTS